MSETQRLCQKYIACFRNRLNVSKVQSFSFKSTDFVLEVQCFRLTYSDCVRNAAHVPEVHCLFQKYRNFVKSTKIFLLK